MTLLGAEGLGHRFGKEWLFRNVEMDVRAGDRLVVTGRNGSGKSTLLKCLVGLMEPREGFVSTRAQFGYSAIDLAVYPQLTCREHVRLFRGEAEGDDAALLTLVGLEKAVDKAAGQLSTGMRGRLKIALALSRDPEVLVLDEPGAALDDAGRELLDHLTGSFSGAIVVATNDPNERRWATHALDLG